VATDADLRRATEIPELIISKEFVRAARERGDRCFAAFDNNEMVAYTWRTETWAPGEGDIKVSVVPPYVYGYKAVTRQSHRGLRLNAILNLIANDVYRAKGFKYLVSYTSPYNVASLRAMSSRFGYERLGYAFHGEILGSSWLIRTKKVRETGINFSNRANRRNSGSFLRSR